MKDILSITTYPANQYSPRLMLILHRSLGCKITGGTLELGNSIVPAMSNSESITKKLPLIALRKPKRITITIPHGVHERLEQLSDKEGRSLSNLAAFLLERGIQKEL